MNIISKFEKVSYKQFKKDFIRLNKNYQDDDDLIKEVYDNIKLPKRATKCSAGYDFYMPIDTIIGSDIPTIIPTGIKCRINYGWVLNIYPRSGHGFKYGTHLVNTIGVIDSDYYDNESNEGHIIIKLINDDRLQQHNVNVNSGEAFCQGIFLQYGVTEDDSATAIRKGGIGSTSNSNE